MKKTFLFLLCIILVSFLVGCNSSENAITDEPTVENAVEQEPTIKEIAGIDCGEVLSILTAKGIPIVDSIVFDETNDPNILAYGSNENSGYLQKANFEDERIGNKDADSIPTNGTIEVFETTYQAKIRASQLSDSNADKYAFRILAENVLVRLSEDYSVAQAEEFANILGGDIYSVSHAVEVREKFGDMLTPFQGEWKSLKSDWHLIVAADKICAAYYATYGDVITEGNYLLYQFDFDDSGSLVVMQYSQPKYVYSMGENGNLITESLGALPITNEYEKISDNTEFPEPPEVKQSPQIGMTELEVLKSTWGSPKRRNTTTTANGESVQWVYDEGYIYFTNGYVTAIQNK